MISGFRRQLYSHSFFLISRNPSLTEMTDMTADTTGSLPDITRFIRSIQRLEGNPDCFGTATGACDRPDCLWREYCLKETQKEMK